MMKKTKTFIILLITLILLMISILIIVGYETNSSKQKDIYKGYVVLEIEDIKTDSNLAKDMENPSVIARELNLQEIISNNRDNDDKDDNPKKDSNDDVDGPDDSIDDEPTVDGPDDSIDDNPDDEPDGDDDIDGGFVEQG